MPISRRFRIEKLVAAGRKAAAMQISEPGITLRELAPRLGISPSYVVRALRAAGLHPSCTPATRNTQYQALLELGGRARAMVDCGLPIRQVALHCKTSRPRIYRALALMATAAENENCVTDFKNKENALLDDMLL